MSSQTVPQPTHEQFVVKYCEQKIREHHRRQFMSRWLTLISRTAIALLSGLTPLLILGQDFLPFDEKFIQFLQGAFPGMAALIVAIAGIFKWRQEWVQSERIAERLTLALLKYRAGVTERQPSGRSELTPLDQLVQELEQLIGASIDMGDEPASSQAVPSGGGGEVALAPTG